MGAGPRLIDRIAAVVTHVFYRTDVIGGIPASGPLLLLPNHPNALLDPALVMATAGRPVRFLAKSTLFSGPFRPLLAAADAIPVYRKQDGVEMGRNEGTFAAVEDALARGEVVCVFPEGISHSSGRLEPLRTGAARMALRAATSGTAVRLVPVGINLEQKSIFRSRAIVVYGAPFEIEGTRSTDGSGLDPVKHLTNQIAARMRALLVEADPRADVRLVDRVNRLFRAGQPYDREPLAEFARQRTIAEAIHRLRAERPDRYASALLQLRRYDERLRRFKLTDDALDWDVSSAAARRFAAREAPLAVGLVPVAASALLVFAIPYMLTAGAAKITRELDVTATTKVFAGSIIYSVWIALLAALAYAFWGTAFAVGAVFGLPLLAIAGLFAIERESAAWRTARAWLALRGARPASRAALRRRRAELAGVLDEVNEWLTTHPDQRERGDTEVTED